MKRFLCLSLLFLFMSSANIGCRHLHLRRHPGPDNFYFGSYSEAEALYNQKQYEQAIEKYQAYIDENPQGNMAVISQYYIAKSHAALGHTKEAKKIYKKIIKEHPDLVWANFSQTQLNELQKSSDSDNIH